MYFKSTKPWLIRVTLPNQNERTQSTMITTPLFIRLITIDDQIITISIDQIKYFYDNTNQIHMADGSVVSLTESSMNKLIKELDCR